MRRKKKLKVGMLVNVINRFTSEVMPEVYVIVLHLDGGVWEVSPISDLTIKRHFHTNQLVEVKCK